MPLFAMSFALWKCNGCGQEVEWEEAVVTDTDELFCVRHKDCTE